MNLDKIKDFFANLSAHDLPAGGAGLAGIILVILVFRSRKLAHRILFFLMAAGLFAGAWWWHTHK
jgi:hypothetical protein